MYKNMTSLPAASILHKRQVSILSIFASLWIMFVIISMPFSAYAQAEGENKKTLVFSWPNEVAATVFKRENFLWIVFFEEGNIDTLQMLKDAAPMLETFERIPFAGVTVLRARMSVELNVNVQRRGLNWFVMLQEAENKDRQQINITTGSTEEYGRELIFDAPDTSKTFFMQSPDIGDKILLIGYISSAHSNIDNRTYPEFDILDSAQGIAIITHNDEINTRSIKDIGFAIYSENGLNISGVPPTSTINEGVLLTSYFMDIEKWLGNDKFFVERSRLYNAIANSKRSNINNARLDLARFLFARGLSYEALGILNRISSVSPGFLQTPENTVLFGAVQALTGKYEESIATLSSVTLRNNIEAAIWLAYTYSQLGRWDEAERLFLATDEAIDNMPFPLRGEVAIVRLRSAIANRNIDFATTYLNDLSLINNRLTRTYQNELEYQRGRLALTRNDRIQARRNWENVSNTPDIYNSVRAQYALTNLQLQEKSISVENAITKLRTLSMSWRGDALEISILKRLGRLFFQDGNLLRGLEIMRTIVVNYPDHPVASELTSEMVLLFQRAVLDPNFAEPLRALAIYESFRELTPSGDIGDRIIESLVKRLVSVDLLDRAISLIERNIKNRYSKERRAIAGVKAATLHLINGNPENALNILLFSNYAQLPEKLRLDRRRLRAKAIFDLGEPESALKLLSGDNSREADLLRRDIFWDLERWPDASIVLQRLSGPPVEENTKIPDHQARNVLQWILALQLSNDRQGMKAVQDLYEASMKESVVYPAFHFITRSLETENSSETYLQQLERIYGMGDIGSFLEEYKASLIPDEEITSSVDARVLENLDFEKYLEDIEDSGV